MDHNYRLTTVHLHGNGFTAHCCRLVEHQLAVNAKYQRAQATRAIQQEVDVKKLAKHQMRVVVQSQKGCVAEHSKIEHDLRHWRDYSEGKKVEYSLQLDNEAKRLGRHAKKHEHLSAALASVIPERHRRAEARIAENFQKRRRELQDLIEATRERNEAGGDEARRLRALLLELTGVPLAERSLRHVPAMTKQAERAERERDAAQKRYEKAKKELAAHERKVAKREKMHPIASATPGSPIPDLV